MTRPGLLGAAAVLMVSWSAGAAHAGVPEDIKRLIETGRAQEAFELGQRHPEMIGDPLFDYYYGVAAIDGGRVSLGVFSLERFLLRDPSNDLARLELARGYYVLGDFPRARREFNYVLGRKPPPGVRATVQKFLDDIARQESSSRAKLTGFLEQGFGYNSNANGGLSNATLTLPVFGAVTLSSDALSKPTAFATTTGNVRYEQPFSKTLKGFVSSSGSRTGFAKLSNFDQSLADASTGLEWSAGKAQVSGAVGAGYAYLGRAPYRQAFQGGLSGGYALDKQTDLVANASYARLKYFGASRPRGSDLSAISVGGTRRTDLPSRPAFSLQATLAREATRRDRPDFSRGLVAGYANVVLSPLPNFSISIGAGRAHSSYDGADPLFGIRRKDDLSNVDLALGYRFSPAVSARVEGGYADNVSNINLYAFRQLKGGVTVRYAWN